MLSRDLGVGAVDLSVERTVKSMKVGEIVKEREEHEKSVDGFGLSTFRG